MDFKDNRVLSLKRSKNRYQEDQDCDWAPQSVQCQEVARSPCFLPDPSQCWPSWPVENVKKYKTNIFPLIRLHLSPPPPPVETDFDINGLEGTCPPKVVQKRCARIQGIPTYSLYGKQILKVVFCGTIHYNLKARLHLDKNLLQKSLLLTNQCWPCVHEAQIARRPGRAVRSFSFFHVWQKNGNYKSDRSKNGN